MKFLLNISVFLISYTAIAQTGRLTAYGRVQHNKSIVKDVKIEVYKDNKLYIETKNTFNGSFKVEMPMGSVYSISYSKDTYISKSVAVLTKAQDSTINGRFFYQLDIELFKEEDDKEDETLLPPVAKLYIKDINSGFKFDKKYVRWVADEYDEKIEE